MPGTHPRNLVQMNQAEAECPLQRHRAALRPNGKSAGHHDGRLDGLSCWSAGAFVPNLLPVSHGSARMVLAGLTALGILAHLVAPHRPAL